MKIFNIMIMLMMSTAVLAAPSYTVIGAVPVSISPRLPKAHTGMSKIALPQKWVMMQKIQLTPAAQKYLAAQVKQPQLPQSAAGSDNLPAQIFLGMNGVPVLDQGMHGTCVTFAVTAALDAVLGKGDYISQLCNLELGKALEHYPDYPSGWDGSSANIVFNQINRYGIVSISSQNTYGCGGNNFAYPTYNSDEGMPYPVQEFTQHSEYVMQTIQRAVLLDENVAFTPAEDANQLLAKTKLALSKGHRVVVGVLVDANVNFGSPGVLGTYKNAYDSWIMTPDIKSDLAAPNRIHWGHEMIIIGYDDNAVIKGVDGSTHTGAFILRNSWGAYAGDQGNYYMSYEYFQLMSNEVGEVI
jgi:hypothetical protein